MRDYASIMEVRNAWCGVVLGSEADACTAYGASIDTTGFQDVLAAISIGNIYGTAGRASDITISIQESDSINASFATIGDGLVNGSMTTTIAVLHSTYPIMYVGKLYERLGPTSITGGTRKRYLRPHISIIGTANANMGAAISVAMLLGRPKDTLYIQNPVIAPTGGAEYTGYIAGSYMYGKLP